MGSAAPPLAKLAPPALSGVVPRLGLFRKLDAARAPIVWLEAPAGSGKTTGAASYLRARRRPFLWYQLDARDADPATFFFYLREGAARLDRRAQPLLPLLTPEYALGADAYARSFFETLGLRLPRRSWLVLDDYEELPEHAPLHLLLPDALAALPRGARVLVASRSAPPPPFARLEADGRVATIGPEALTLTAGETRALARVRARRALSLAAAEALRSRAGGWAAGTVLLLDARAAAPSPRACAEGGAQGLLFDYFAAEVFDRLSRVEQRVLLAIALLPEVDAATAEALTGDRRSGELLSELVRRGAFTTRVAGGGSRYRLNPLFREFLLARARIRLTHAARLALAARAADLLVAAGSPDAAAHLLVRERSPEPLADLVRRHARALARQGRLASVEAWLDALPEAVVAADPWLTYWRGACRVAAPREARPLFEAALGAFRERRDVEGALTAWSAFAATFFYVWDDFHALAPRLSDVEQLCGPSTAFPSVELEAQVTFGMLAGLMWCRPADPRLPRWRERATALLESGAPPELRMRLAAYLSMYWSTWRGDVAAAERVLARVAPLVTAPDVTPLTELLWIAVSAHCRARAGEGERCARLVERGLATARRTGALRLVHVISVQGVYAGLDSGDLELARRYHAAARAQVGDHEASRSHVERLGAWISLCAGDVAGAYASAAEAVLHAEASGAEIAGVAADHTLAHVLLERGEIARAVALLEGAVAWAHRIGDAATLQHALLSIAYARMLEGRTAECAWFLREGLRLGAERGVDAAPGIGWRRDVMARLAAAALELGVEVESARRIVGTLRLEPPEEAAAIDAWPWPVRIYTLGRFELWRGAERVRFARRVPRKPLELLEAVIALGGAEVREEAVCDALWPDADGDCAHRSLEAALHRARRLLGGEHAIVQQDRRLTLARDACWVDALALRHLLLERSRPTPGGDGAARDAARIAALYRGPFLAEASDALPVAVALRATLRAELARWFAAHPGPQRAHDAVAACRRACAEHDPTLGA